MDSTQAIQVASIVNSFVQALVYGAYIITLVHCLRWIMYNDEGWSRRKKMDMTMLIVSIAVFLLQTAGLATAFKTTLELQDSNTEGFNLLNMINVCFHRHQGIAPALRSSGDALECDRIHDTSNR